MNGISRISLQDQRVFIDYMLKWMTVASAEDCKKLINLGESAGALESGAIEMKYYGRFGREELRSYYSVIRKALLAEINDFPAPRTLNSQQVKLADDAFEQELIRKIKSGAVEQSTLDAMQDMKQSSPQAVCSAGKFIFSTVRNMKGFGGDLMLTKLMLSMGQ